MPTIVIKDLSESVDLDRQAMLAISGGARLRGRPAPLSGQKSPARIIDYPGTPSLRRPAAENAGKPHGRK